MNIFLSISFNIMLWSTKRFTKIRYHKRFGQTWDIGPNCNGVVLPEPSLLAFTKNGRWRRLSPNFRTIGPLRRCTCNSCKDMAIERWPSLCNRMSWSVHRNCGLVRLSCVWGADDQRSIVKITGFFFFFGITLMSDVTNIRWTVEYLFNFPNYILKCMAWGSPLDITGLPSDAER